MPLHLAAELLLAPPSSSAWAGARVPEKSHHMQKERPKKMAPWLLLHSPLPQPIMKGLLVSSADF